MFVASQRSFGCLPSVANATPVWCVGLRPVRTGLQAVNCEPVLSKATIIVQQATIIGSTYTRSRCCSPRSTMTWTRIHTRCCRMRHSVCVCSHASSTFHCGCRPVLHSCKRSARNLRRYCWCTATHSEANDSQCNATHGSWLRQCEAAAVPLSAAHARFAAGPCQQMPWDTSPAAHTPLNPARMHTHTHTSLNTVRTHLHPTHAHTTRGVVTFQPFIVGALVPYAELRIASLRA